MLAAGDKFQQGGLAIKCRLLRAFERRVYLLGIFHTHTHSEAYPSKTDRERALWPEGTQASFPDSYYLIMSLSDREKPVLRAFTITDGGEVSEEDLVVS